MKHRKNQPPGGLTILELLVSVTILTLLASLLLPAVLQARGAARRTACRNNLRQWALAVHLYADTHAGRLPYRGQGVRPTTQLTRLDDWFNALPPFMENTPYAELAARASGPKAGDASVWVCPEASQQDLDDITWPNRPIYFAYAMNMALSTPFNGRPDNIEKVGPKQNMVFMADSKGPYCSTLPSEYDFTPIDRHLGGTVNIAFLDGRVESYAGDYVGVGSGDPKHEHIRWYPPNTRWPGPPK
jgi:prepilin-type processing-associated H-X9-DG protein